jgi:hypothetical protein
MQSPFELFNKLHLSGKNSPYAKFGEEIKGELDKITPALYALTFMSSRRMQ